jgi:hypothetical protein
MLIQVHHQWPDHTDPIAQFDSDEVSDYWEEIRGIQDRHPIPEGAIWLVCTESSEFFSKGKDDSTC